MKALAISEAESAYAAADAAFQKARIAQSHEETVECWITFIHAAQRLFNKLAAGSKGNPSSEKFRTKISAERDADKRLTYIRQARHSDEHGIEPQSILRHTDVFVTNAGKMDGKPVHIMPVSTFLVPVTNRGVTFNPPQPEQASYAFPGHDPRSPGNVMYKALPIYRSWIDEAKKLQNH